MNKSAQGDYMTDDKLHLLKTVGELSAGSIVLGTLLKVLPAIAAALAIVWYTVMIPVWLYEKITGKTFSESWLARLLTGKR